MKRLSPGARTSIRALILATASLAALIPSAGIVRPAAAAQPPSLRGPIATIGDRTVEAIDIQKAAVVFANDPLRRQSPSRWRRMLLDRVVDRELLSMEAARRGLDKDPEVRQRVIRNEYLRLFPVVDKNVLASRIEPTPEQLEDLRRGGLYRVVDLHLIIVLDNPQGGRRAEVVDLANRIRAGASFDSVARLHSAHLSRRTGGHFGPAFLRDMDSTAWSDARAARPGDVIGPYTSSFGHQIYKIGGFSEVSRDSLFRLVSHERKYTLVRDYQAELMAKYGFALESEMVQPALFAAASEARDSLLASLGPDGTRPRRGSRAALGVIARAGVDSITLRDLILETNPLMGPTGRVRLRGESHLRELAESAMFKRLLVRDAKERGLAKDPEIARDLRLMADEAAVRVMVARARPADPGPAALQAWFDQHVSRYGRPAAWRVRAAAFPTHDSALASLRAWNGVGIADSALHALGFAEQAGAGATSLYPGRTAIVTVFENDDDALALAARSLSDGRLTPVVRTPQGYVVGQVVGREPARAYALEEIAERVRRDWREEKENEWVLSQLERMRATTAVRVIPARLEAVKIGSGRGSPKAAGTAAAP